MKTLIAVVALTFCFGCASLNNKQEYELTRWEQEGIAIQDKNPTTGAWLGVLPGVGSFYTGQIGLGIVDVLTWPLSIAWDTSSGYQGSKVKNWEQTSIYVEKLERNRKTALDNLEDMRDRKRVSDLDYRKVRRLINNAGLKEFEKEYDIEARLRD